MSVCERDIRSMYQMLYYVCVRMCAYVYCVCACCVCVCVVLCSLPVNPSEPT